MELTALIAPIAGLGGVVAGLLVGHARWKVERATASKAPYVSQRRDAYADLWRTVEQAHVAARKLDPHPEAENALLRNVNEFAMVNAVYIDEPDRQLAFDYMKSVLTLIRAVRIEGDPDWNRAIHTTAAFPSEFGATVTHLAERARQVETVRRALQRRVMQETGGIAP